MKEDATFHVGVKAIINNAENKILLLKAGRKGPRYWDLPGVK